MCDHPAEDPPIGFVAWSLWLIVVTSIMGLTFAFGRLSVKWW